MTPAPPRAAAPRDFPLFQVARFSAILAAQMMGVAVAYHVYDLTGSALDLGFVGLAQFLPAALLSLVSGHVVDRFDRRNILLLGYFGLAVCALALYALARAHLSSVMLVYVTLVVIGTIRAFTNPASSALLPSLVPPERFPRAVAVGSTVWQIALGVGPPLGGFVYAQLQRPGPVYVACAIVFMLTASLVLAMRVRTGRSEARGMSMETLLAGVRYVWSNKVLLGAISLDLFAVLLGGAVALLPIFARDILHTGPLGFGVLRAAPAAGAAAIAIVLRFVPIRRRAGAIMLACVFVFGLATIVFGRSTSFALSLAALLVVGASDMVSVFVRQTLVQLTTPDAMRGRVSAVNMVFIGASNELGEFESGVTAAWLGAVPAVVVGGIGTCLVVALWAVLFPKLRDVDRLAAAEP